MRFLCYTVAAAVLTSLVSSRPASQAATPDKPDQTEPNEAPNCDYWYIAEAAEETCFTIARDTGLSLVLLFEWNPALKDDCFSVKPGWGYCINASEAPPRPTTSAVSTTTTTTTSATTSNKTTATSTTTPAKTTTSTTTSNKITTTTTTLIKITTTTTTSTTKSTTTLSTTTGVVWATFTPEKFPPKSGESSQCAEKVTGQGQLAYAALGGKLNHAVAQACAKIVPGAAKWLEKGNAYYSPVTVDNQTIKFYVKIWLGGFEVPRDLCLKQMTALVKECAYGNPAAWTYGGCSYSDDLNLQACIFPTVRDASTP
ncbi:hypothetical protein TWF696_007986 [Orbilia brochopaga]|uniref:LysM domain-containing protein n=1 Tax=Orbilia brochopaga TaxID=3140254 RepID=A0AAV9UQ66_9PEZI